MACHEIEGNAEVLCLGVSGGPLPVPVPVGTPEGAGEGSGLMSGLRCARACVFARAGHVGLMIHWAASCHLSRACLRDHCGLTFVILGVYL